MDTNRSGTPIIFVYLGNPLPKYAVINLGILARNPDLPVVLISSEIEESLPNSIIQIQPSPSWYSPEGFLEFREKSSVDPLFRGGFWLHAAERLFVLHAFVDFFRVDKFFHAELDMLILNLRGFSKELDSFGKGIFIPPESQNRALASLIYVNDSDALGMLIHFAAQNSQLGNEMKILGHFLALFPKNAFALASDRIFDSKWPFGLNAVPAKFGLVDTSGFGQWLFGPDPRNVRGSTFTKYRSRGQNFTLEGMRFSLDSKSRTLHVESASRGSAFEIRAVHVHSKIFHLLTPSIFLKLLVVFSNFGIRVPIDIRSEGFFSRVFQMLVSKRILDTVAEKPQLVLRLYKHAAIWTLSRTRIVPSVRVKTRLNKVIEATSRYATYSQDSLSLLSWSSLPASFADFDESLLSSTALNEFSAKLEIKLFLFALRTNEDFFIHPSSFATGPILRMKSCDERSTPLILSDCKAYVDTRHALSFWYPERLGSHWSFRRDAQLVRIRWVREMFPNGDSDVVRWAEIGLRTEQKRISALRSYATWAQARKRTHLVYLPDAEEESPYQGDS